MIVIHLFLLKERVQKDHPKIKNLYKKEIKEEIIENTILKLKQKFIIILIRYNYKKFYLNTL